MVVDGKKLAEEILLEIKKEFKKLPQRLTVGAVLVGKNPASISFLKQKSKAAEKFSLEFKVYQFKSQIKTLELISEIKKLNASDNINGIIVQLPLPPHINADKILGAIDQKKDIDALSKKPLILSPLVEAVKYIFGKYKIDYQRKNILIIGRGRLVGGPIYQWLSKDSGRVKIIDERQKNTITKFTRGADIIISGTGVAGLVKGHMVKREAILIDFGFNQSHGKIKGDFEFNSCIKKAKLITPVPGGMGPIMVMKLFKNLLTLNKF